MRQIAILILLMLAGCARPGPMLEPQSRDVPPSFPEAGAMVNKFAFDFFAELRKTETGKNIFVSPYSISTALGMTATGARNNTFEQMKKVLHLPDDATADANYANLAAVLKGGKGYELSTANAVWAQGGKYPWEEPFKKRLVGYGVDAFREVDFIRDPESARKMVNDWAKQQTKEKIKELLREETVTIYTRMVLANAIYFKGQWETKFDPKQTKDGPFSNADGTKSTVPFMTNQKMTIEYSGSGEASVLALPYIGNELQMVIVLPRKEDGLEALQDKLNPEIWEKWMTGLRRSEGHWVSLPKFKLAAEYKLNEVLQNQGMPDSFDWGVANFTGMTTGEKLYISHVAHKAFVEVNEEGTEAAAATAVVIGTKSAKASFTINRPFLFAIRHRGTGAILFLGRVEKF